MRIYRTQGHTTRIALYSIDGNGSDIKDGALVMRGVSDETDKGTVILASSAGADAVGILEELHDFDVTGDTTMEDGLVDVRRRVGVLLPGDEVAAEFSHLNADDSAVASMATTQTMRITSQEDDTDGGWVYVISGASAGLLSYIIENDGTDLTLKTVPTIQPDNTSLVSHMRPRFHQTTGLSADATKLRTAAAAGSLPWRTLDLQILEPGASRWESLNPTIHDNRVYGGASSESATIGGPRFRAILSPANTLLNPTD